MGLEGKDKLDAYLKLYERQMAHYENTQNVEWRGSFGIWTLLAAAVYWASQNLTAARPVVIDSWLVLALFLVPVTLHGSWLLKCTDPKNSTRCCGPGTDALRARFFFPPTRLQPPRACPQTKMNTGDLASWDARRGSYFKSASPRDWRPLLSGCL